MQDCEMVEHQQVASWHHAAGCGTVRRSEHRGMPCARSRSLTHSVGGSEHFNVFGVMGANTCACAALQTAAIMEEHLVRHDAFSDEVGRLTMLSTHASFISPHDKNPHRYWRV